MSAPALGWLVLVLGLAAVMACLLLPREIGKEDEPLSSLRLPRPDLEGLALRLRRPQGPPRTAARPRPAAPAQAQVVQPEPPSAMGAPQPVLTEQPAAGLALPS